MLVWACGWVASSTYVAAFCHFHYNYGRHSRLDRDTAGKCRVCVCVCVCAWENAVYTVNELTSGGGS